MVTGRLVCAFVLILWLTLSAQVSAQSAFPGNPQRAPVRIGITPVFLDNQTAFLDRWRDYLASRLERPVEFSQRSTYRQIIELLLSDDLDYAWICGYPYLQFRAHLELVAVPLYQGEPYYRSLLIVPSHDQETEELSHLKGKIFAYADPDSNSGYLVPQARIKALGENRDTFFRKSFFTWAHAKVVRAVADGLANGGAVDGYVWETLSQIDPGLTGRTRVVSKSQRFGFPPFVARDDVSPAERHALRDVLIGMQSDAAGRRLLSELNLDGFREEGDELYTSIRALMDSLGTP